MSNNVNQQGKSGGYHHKSSKNIAEQYNDDSWRVNYNNIGSNLFSLQRWTGLLPSLTVLIIFVTVFVAVLPNLDVFNHVIKDETAASGSDMVDYIKPGDDGAEVLSLQRSLFKLGGISIDDVTGIYDEKSMNAVNQILRDHSMKYGESCSLESYKYIIALTENNGQANVVSDTTADTDNKKDNGKGSSESEKTTQKTTKGTDNKDAADKNEDSEVQMIRISEDSVRLYAKSKEASTTLFLLEKNDEYKLLEKYTDENGKLWYKIEYKDICNGWVKSEKAEEIS